MQSVLRPGQFLRCAAQQFLAPSLLIAVALSMPASPTTCRMCPCVPRLFWKQPQLPPLSVAGLSFSSSSSTTTDLAEHNGLTAGKDLWVAADGFVFNVEAGRDFYGPGSSYAAFSGR